MRDEKKLLLTEVDEYIDGDFVLMRYQGLTANAATSFRNELAKAGGKAKVIRKRVLLLAAEKNGLELTEEQLEGHIGVCKAGEDSVALAKTLVDFGKDNGDAVQLIGGKIDGQQYNQTQMTELAKLPGKDELRSQLVGVLSAPMAETVAVLNGALSSVVCCIENKLAKGE